MIRLAADDPAAPAAFWDTLRAGGLVAYPTDTLYGLGTDATNPDALRRLQALKGRQGPFSVLVGSLAMLWDYALVSPAIAGKLSEMLPGPYTMILPLSPDHDLPSPLIGPEGKVGFRCSSDSFLQRAFGAGTGLVVSTSVNLTARPPLQHPDEIQDQFRGQLDLLVDAGSLPPSRGSTILDPGTMPWKVLRQGDGRV